MEERRVRYTDDYVPGPEGAPVWMIEKRRYYAVPYFIRADTEEEAMEIFNRFYDENTDDVDWDLGNADAEDETEIFYHADAQHGWKK